MFSFTTAMRLDPLDLKIIRLLQDDARLSYREIAERLSSTTPTVSARVKALEDIGIVQGYRVQLDPNVLGGASFVVSITVQPAFTDGALAAVKRMRGVHSSHLLAGGRLIARVQLRPPEYALAHLHKSLAQLEGLVTYDASEIIAGHEPALVEELPEDVEVPCHQCKGPIRGEPVKAKLGLRTHVFCCRHCLATFRERFDAAQSAAEVPRAPAASKARPPRRAQRLG